MHALLVGTVTTRKGARLHLAVAGRAHCGAGNGRILGPGRELTPDNAAVVCRRCSRRVAVLVTEAIAVAARRRDGARRLVQLDRVADLLRTPAQVAADAALVADIRATMLAAVEPVAAPVALLPAAEVGQLAFPLAA